MKWITLIEGRFLILLKQLQFLPNCNRIISRKIHTFQCNTLIGQIPLLRKISAIVSCRVQMKYDWSCLTYFNYDSVKC